MLVAGIASRAGPSASRSAASWIHTSQCVEGSRSKRARPERESPPKSRTVASNVAEAGLEFLASGPALLRVLRNKQIAYRTKGSASRHAADRSLARSEVQWIVEHVCGKLSQRKQDTVELTREQRRSLIHLSTQMTRKNVPLSYLLGTMPFGSLPQPLIVREPVLIPRPETEHWATAAANSIIARLRASNAALSTLRMADLCTGSGCVALLVAHILRTEIGADGWQIVACDRSPEAVRLAKENRDLLGFTEEQVQIYQSDLFEDADMMALCQHAGGPFDVILSNPPYIPRREWEKLALSVKMYEDPIALIGERDAQEHSKRSAAITGASAPDRDGLAFHRRLAQLAYLPWFSTLSIPANKLPSPTTPRLLVAEYGKGQNGAAYKIYVAQVPPYQRLPTIVKLSEQLFICGVGNARTHPLTRHSIGQVVLDSLLDQLVAIDRTERQRLTDIKSSLSRLGENRLENKSLDPGQHQDWSRSIPEQLPMVQISIPDQNAKDAETFSLAAERNLRFDLRTDYQTIVTQGGRSRGDGHPTQLTTAAGADKGGWSAALPILVPSSTDSSIVYQIDVVLYKPSLPMNVSGVGLRAFLESQPEPNKVISATENILVLQDELDLEFGEVNRRDKGSARGHNGIRDIFVRLKIPDSAGGQKLTRVRIGIGRPRSSKDTSAPSRKSKYKGKGDAVMFDWVLSRLEDAELTSVCEGAVLNKVADTTAHWIRDRVKALAPDVHALRQLPGFTDHLSQANREDQFGVDRVIWIEK